MHTLVIIVDKARGEIVSRRIEEGQAYTLRTRAPLHRNAASSELELIFLCVPVPEVLYILSLRNQKTKAAKDRLPLIGAKGRGHVLDALAEATQSLLMHARRFPPP
jgi:hypothetical protein